MKLLLDTHTLIWFIEGNPALSMTARRHIEDTSNELYLSVASLWEMAIKVSLGKLTLAQPLGTLIPQQLALNSIQLLNITVSHVAEVASMPFHHKDPFDRLLIAQSLVEGMPIIGVDTVFDAYGVSRIW